VNEGSRGRRLLSGEDISVCLLTYNHVDVIESTLQSIISQTVSDYEIIVSDDCSSDGTWERILEFAAANRRVRPMRTPRNLGMPGNANFAVKRSTRPYIALLHHDDLYRGDLLEKWAGVLRRYADVGFVFNAYEAPNAERASRNCFTEEHLDGKWFLQEILFKRWDCPVRGTAMIRRSSLHGMQ
jgi:glycosyltransferase involved in cell wall biosynthesis